MKGGRIINNIFDNLIEKFKSINEMGYVKGINNNITNSCGLTFESLLGKKADNKYMPDFENIEIKTTQRFSRYSIGMFSLTFDGPDKYESNYLLQKYGKENVLFQEKKELIVNFKTDTKVVVYDNYYFQIGIDYLNERLFIKIFDSNYNYLESRGFLNFSSIKDRLEEKLKYLGLVFGSKKIINDSLYYRYYMLNCYKLKDFKTFLSLIESGDIELTLMLRFAKSGIDIGKNKNKNIVFRIKKNSINKLFEKVYTYEN